MSNTGVHLLDRPHYVYKFIASDGRVLYVGCTSDLGTRMSQHTRQRPWWGEVAHIEVTTYPDKVSGLAAERSAIRAHEPVHNSVYSTPETPRAMACGKCRRLRHDECKVTNRNGSPCICLGCNRGRASA